MGPLAFLKRLPPSPAIAMVLGAIVTLPTLWAGVIMDDVLARVKLLGVDSPWSPAPWWDLYTFAHPDLNQGLMDSGLHPWWADPDVKMTFFRPLSAATHVLDYALWPDSPTLQHCHSVLWYVLGVGCVYGVLRGVYGVGSKLVPLGALLFALAAPHALTVGWLAGRNTLIAFVLACGMFHLHVRWRRGGSPLAGLGALGLLVLGFFTSEAMLAGVAYVLAWECCAQEDPWPSRLKALVPYVLVIGGWRLLYVAAGFGSAATDIYHDPNSDLLGFFGALATNVPVLMMGRWALFPLDLWAILPEAIKSLGVWMAAGGVLGLGVLFAPLFKGSPLARFWGLGMVGSLVPFAATLPMDRLVLFAGLGSSALLAEAIAGPCRDGIGRALRGGLLVLHVPVSFALGLVRAGTLAVFFSANSGGFAQAPQDDAVPEQTFVYISNTFHRVHYTTLMRIAEGEPGVPKRSLVLTSMGTGAEVLRRDIDTLEVTPDGGFMALQVDRIHRRHGTGFEVGDWVQLPDVGIEILSLNDAGRVAKAAFHFKRPLEDPSYRWLWVQPTPESTFPPVVETRAFPLPKIGEGVTVKSVL